MKKILITLLFLFSTFLIAQSDYETTQDFKEKVKVITNTIRNIHTQSELDRAISAIDKLKKDFLEHKELLDKALYPEDFEKVFEKLNKSVESKKNEIGRLTNLENKITDLRVQITDLNDKNMILLGDIKELTRLRATDSLKIAELNLKVKVLAKQIKERDNLVLGLVDSLLSDFMNKPEKMTDVAKANLERKINTRNLFENIKRTLNDNLDFLELTVFDPNDLLELKKQQQEFKEVWDKLGPQLTEFYLEKAEKKDELNNINTLFTRWNEKIDASVWRSIDYYFDNYNVNLLPYNNGNEFTANILAYITIELNSIENKAQEELLTNYHTFNDSVWVKDIRPIWLPMLLENDYLTSNQRNTIEEKIVAWELAIDDDNQLMIIYIVFGVLFIIFAGIVVKKYRK